MGATFKDSNIKGNIKSFLTSRTLCIQYGPTTNNTCYSNIDALKLCITLMSLETSLSLRVHKKHKKTIYVS